MLTTKPTYEELEKKVLELETALNQREFDVYQCRVELLQIAERFNVSEEIFKQFLFFCPIYVFFKDENIRIVHLSNNFEQMLGQPIEKLIGKRMDEVFPSELAAKMIEDDRRVLQSGKICEVEECLNDRIYYTLKFPIFQNGKPAYLAGFTMDITDRKNSENLIIQNTKALEELNSAKDKLFSVISHDLRNSFNSVLGFSDFLRQYAQTYDKDRIEEISGHIYVASRNTYNLLTNLLDWAKSHLNQLSLIRSDIDVVLLIEGLMAEMRTIAQKKSINIVFSDSYNIVLKADQNMVSTILRNLITNAIKFSNTGGEITISVNDYDEFVEFEVADNGVGMKDEVRRKLFQSNINESHEGTIHEQGTGLGLVICKEFVEKHGGVIWVDSELGKGSTFKFTISKIFGEVPEAVDE